jgi:DNA gyrase subunit B
MNQEHSTAADPANVGLYDGSMVEIFQNTEHIRQRPAMYIGDTTAEGLHHLVYELVYNSVDEALAGFAKTIVVKINLDGSLSVSDDGRGIPVDEHPERKRSTLEVVLTTVGAGAKFGKGAYRVSAGLHGVGAKAVTALSEWVEAEVRRDGKVYVQEYERGLPITEVEQRGTATSTGTRITFRPDPEIFPSTKFEYGKLEGRLRELAYLNKGLSITLIEEESDEKVKQETFSYQGGIAEYVLHLNKDLEERERLHPPIFIEKQHENVRVEVALQYTSAEDQKEFCYGNNGYTPMGGTHQSGFRKGLTQAIKAHGKKLNVFKPDMEPTGNDCREGLTVVVSVQVPDPQFEGQTKVRLLNPEVDTAVASAVSEFLAKYMEENPKEAQRILNRVKLAAEAREAAAKARKALKDRKSILNGGGLPGKLFDCSDRDSELTELFLVEGDSAAGSAVEGRKSEFQAILPLRGKPLNVEKARPEAMLKNEEITSLISAIGIDIGEHSEEEVERKIRYGKVIIMTDADVDGKHIRTLLLTFFYRQMPRLVAEGRVYVARPPLFKVTEKKQVRFVQTEEDMTRQLMGRGLKNTRFGIYPAPVGDAPQGEPHWLAGPELEALLLVMHRLEYKLEILERRGVNLPTFLGLWGEQGLPIYRVVVGGHERWCHTRDEVEALRQQEQQRLGRAVVAEEASGTALAPAHGAGSNGKATEVFYEQELHEVRDVNRLLQELAKFGLRPLDLVPQPRIAGREPPVRLKLESGEQSRLLLHLRDLVTEVRRLGEKGLTVTRFKGLGEMDPAELWDTTLDPEKRMLMRVQLDDALKADEMFRTLMGEKVEPRRDFIVKHALEAKDTDWHGA